jgi:hypothetical protein
LKKYFFKNKKQLQQFKIRFLDIPLRNCTAFKQEDSIEELMPNNLGIESPIIVWRKR